MALGSLLGAALALAIAVQPGRPAGAATGAHLLLAPAAQTVQVGSTAVVTITLNDISNLYGYQLAVGYDASKVSAEGAFVNEFVDTTSQAFVPGGWHAACTGGQCRFAVTRLSPAAPVSGGGAVARITFTGLARGVVPLTYAADYLSDRNGFAIAHLSSGGVVTTVEGTAIVGGVVALQGRATPITTGTVTLIDNAGVFAPTVTPFDALTGVFTAVVPVDTGGSVYRLVAAHALYLSHQLGAAVPGSGIAVAAGGVYTTGATTLDAGDATNDGLVSILDLACMGGAYGGPPTVCGADGSSDINADGVVNIFDLVLAGGNYGRAAPQPW
ncbi:MAG: hypothetical protein HZB53_15300 [Chloroflexi bacterium]|nr:hypothetical protein [Chloroflexota bacterium]